MQNPPKSQSFLQQSVELLEQSAEQIFLKLHCLYGKSRIYCGYELLATQTKSLGQVIPIFQLIPNNTSRIKGIFPVSPPSAGVTQILSLV